MNVHEHPANIIRHDERNFRQRTADSVTAAFGSWGFLIGQTVVIMAWIVANVAAVVGRWDPYPF